VLTKNSIMGLLTPKGKKGDKKSSGAKPAAQSSKFISKGNAKASGGFAKKGMTGGGSQRGS
jgi:hypothetical protein